MCLQDTGAPDTNTCDCSGMAKPHWLATCADATTYGPTCTRTADGTCGWGNPGCPTPTPDASDGGWRLFQRRNVGYRHLLKGTQIAGSGGALCVQTEDSTGTAITPKGCFEPV
jgi:hypothetical protein